MRRPVDWNTVMLCLAAFVAWLALMFCMFVCLERRARRLISARLRDRGEKLGFKVQSPPTQVLRELSDRSDLFALQSQQWHCLRIAGRDDVFVTVYSQSVVEDGSRHWHLLAVIARADGDDGKAMNVAQFLGKIGAREVFRTDAATLLVGPRAVPLRRDDRCQISRWLQTIAAGL